MTLAEVWEVYCDKWTHDGQKKIYLEQLLDELHPKELILFDEIFNDIPIIDDWYNYTYRGKQEEFELIIAEPDTTVLNSKEEEMKAWDRWYNIDEQHTVKRKILENVSLHKIDEELTKLESQPEVLKVFATQPFIKEGVTIKVKDEAVEVGQKEKIRQAYDCFIYYKERINTPAAPIEPKTVTAEQGVLDVDDLVLDEEIILPN
jgi:hypothetical protein